MRTRVLALLPVLVLLGAACQKQTGTVTPEPCSQYASTARPVNLTVNYTYPGKLPDAKILNTQARIKTAKGDIVLELYASDAPCTVSSFVYLAEAGFYNGLTFHRREEGFVIQGGDPNGTGTGGPGYQFADEPVTRNYDRGTVAMANAGRDTNGSQFFIMLADNSTLPKNYTIFGKVTTGLDVVDKIQIGDAMSSVTVEPLGAK